MLKSVCDISCFGSQLENKNEFPFRRNTFLLSYSLWTDEEERENIQTISEFQNSVSFLFVFHTHNFRILSTVSGFANFRKLSSFGYPDPVGVCQRNQDKEKTAKFIANFCLSYGFSVLTLFGGMKKKKRDFVFSSRSASTIERVDIKFSHALIMKCSVLLEMLENSLRNHTNGPERWRK